MAIVGDQGRAAVIEQIETARGRRGVVDEAGQPVTDDAPVKTKRPAGTDRGHGIFDLEANGAVGRDWNVGEFQAFLEFALLGDDGVAVEIDDAFALGAVHGHDWMVAVAGKENHLAGAGIGHADDHRIGGVEHGVTGVGFDVLDDDALDNGKVFDGADIGEAEVVALADVGDDSNVAAVEAEPLAQYAATRRFEDSGIDAGVEQYVASALGTAAIAGINPLVLDIDAVGAGHADAQAVAAENVGDQAHSRCLAVGAGNRDQRNAGIVAVGEHRRNDRFADVAAFAVGGRQVHAQAGRGIEFDDAATLFFEWAQDIVADDVDPGDVEADHLCGSDGALCEVGMHVVGDVGGGAARRQVSVVTQDDALASGGDRIGAQPILGKAGNGDVVEADLGERGGMAFASARISVDLVDQLLDGMHAVADNHRRFAPRGGDKLVADDQNAMVMARQIAFHQYVIADFVCRGVGRFDLFSGGEIDGDPLALIAVLWFDDDGNALLDADFASGGPGVFDAAGRTADRYRNARGAQQFLGELLVLRDRFGDGAGGIHLGGLDAALLAAPTKLDEAALGQPAIGNIACDGGIHNGAGARTETHVFVEFAQAM